MFVRTPPAGGQPGTGESTATIAATTSTPGSELGSSKTGSPAQLIGSPGGGREANGLVGGYVRAARVGGV
ncbi:MAG: hypothetical protein ACRDYA_23225 [Egibacteraceae bacterium]